jgi:hypothetical protein
MQKLFMLVCFTAYISGCSFKKCTIDYEANADSYKKAATKILVMLNEVDRERYAEDSRVQYIPKSSAIFEGDLLTEIEFVELYKCLPKSNRVFGVK